MDQRFQRTARLLGPEAITRLSGCRVLLFGVGGVGGYALEALARSGVGTLDIVDNDEVNLTNINRQILATEDTIGRPKVEVARERVLSINPAILVNTYPVFYLPCLGDHVDFGAYDYVIDAIDTVSAKLDIISRCHAAGTPVISAMGCGNRLDPSKLMVSDISKTHTDPLSKVVRRELRKRGIPHLKVVWSTEAPIRPMELPDTPAQSPADGAPVRRSVPGSTAFVPPAAGLLLASEVVRDLTQFDPALRTKGGKQD
ncbi:MAG: tRNA threonylcarbamoyladenosine dehydratase [Eubacterium sp.]|nr:tRNA threonylcarbamoyladenosine dehydratase [Eubacterium sp.]